MEYIHRVMFLCCYSCFLLKLFPYQFHKPRNIGGIEPFRGGGNAHFFTNSQKYFETYFHRLRLLCNPLCQVYVYLLKMHAGFTVNLY